jgi:polar amino acid transport system ATP-binding protein
MAHEPGYEVELWDIWKSFGANTVLKGINLQVRNKEVICLIGGSGSGKSTMLRCINGLEVFDQGKIYIRGNMFDAVGENTSELRFAKRSRHNVLNTICMVFQQFNLWPHMTVLNNIMTPLLLVRKLSRQEARDRAHVVLAKVGLLDKQDDYPAALSGGQQQRVAIARSLGMGPSIMLFDEPTSALDPALVGEVLTVMRDLAAEGMTMIIVTHEMGFAAQVADRIVFLADGQIEESGPPKKLFGAPRSPKLQEFLKTWTQRNEPLS